jgi:beta-galactosidase
MLYNELLHGGDYNPEQWLNHPEILEKDIEYLKQAKCNEVTLGVFSWSTLEPEEGVFHFEWLEEIIDKLYKNGIYVILATPSGAKPQWLAEKYPEVLRTDEKRVKQLYGRRHNHCLTSPIYREKVKRINGELAKRFAKHPAVIMWHISNELSGDCHCDLCQNAFRNWVRNKYDNKISLLNEKWSTTFWSHTYNSFEQVESPSTIGESILHALNLDWKRFVTDQTIDFVKDEISSIKEYNKEVITVVNMMYYFTGLNYHKFKDVVDVMSWDSYPTWHKKEDYLIGKDTGMYHDFIRSINKKPFLLMESCPSATNWQGVSKLKKPGMHKLSSLQAIAHGSDSVLYFQWRQSVGASEKFHGAVVDHYGGTDTRVFKEVTQTGEELLLLQEVCQSKVKSKVAIIYDIENRWALEDSQGPRNNGLYYKETVQKYYNAFRKGGMNVDIIDLESDLSEYEIVVAPMLYLFRAGIEEKLKQFVANGKIAIVSYWSGIVDENDRCFLGGTPYGLLDVVGLRATEIDGLYDGEENQLVPVEDNELGLAKTYQCTNLCELVEIHSATILMNYGDDFYKDTPVLTVNNFNKGKAYYIGTDASQEFYDDFIKLVLDKNFIEKDVNLELPIGIEVTTRYNEKQKYIFVQNFNRHEVELNDMETLGERILGKSSTKIDAYETIVFKQ